MLLAESEKAKALRSTILERNKGTVPPFLKEKGEKMCIFSATLPLLTFTIVPAIPLPFPRLFHHCIIQCLIVLDNIINVSILADGSKMLAGTRYLASLDATYV